MCRTYNLSYHCLRYGYCCFTCHKTSRSQRVNGRGTGERERLTNGNLLPPASPHPPSTTTKRTWRWRIPWTSSFRMRVNPTDWYNFPLWSQFRRRHFLSLAVQGWNRPKDETDPPLSFFSRSRPLTYPAPLDASARKRDAPSLHRKTLYQL